MFYKQIEQNINESNYFRESLLKTVNERNVLFHKLNFSAKSLFIAHQYMNLKKNIIFITSDDKVAEDYFDDLILVAGKENVQFLPDFEILPYEQRSPHYTISGQRISALSKAVSDRHLIFVCSIRAFLRKIVSPETFKSNLISLKIGDVYAPDKLVSDLVGMGYKNEFQVSRLGETAKRGGIIDVFSPNFDTPLRIEYFGDEITSIRPFSVSSQRSIGEEINSVNFLPSREFSLHNIETSDKLWEKVHEKGFYEGIELDASLLLPDISVFGDYFDDAIFFFDEFQYTDSCLERLQEETTELRAKAKLNRPKDILPEIKDVFADKKYLENLIKTANVHYLSNSYQEFPGISDYAEAPVIPQTSVHGDLDIVTGSIDEKLQSGYEVIIQSDNRSQSQRMKEILADYAGRINFKLGCLHKGFTLTDSKLTIFTDHEIFSRYKQKRNSAKFSKDEALTDYKSLKLGDYIVHIDYGIGIYEGLKKMTVEGNNIECLVLTYAGKDRIYVPTFQLQLVSKFVSEEGYVPTIHKIGGKKWDTQKKRARKQIETSAKDLIKLYAERRSKRGISFDPDNTWQEMMEEAFIYEDTPDQKRASEEIKADMESPVPMERLLCGDVGFGKTEVAIRAAFKAVLSGYQVAILVPTTLLAEQHYLVFKERLAQYPVTISMLSRFRTKTKIKKDIEKLKAGETDIVIGTHRILSKDVIFKNLGLLIVDEEHRFGVRHKEKLRKFKSNIDTLYMSATPIPRTLNMALSKMKEISLIQTSPKARLPVRTIISRYDEPVIKEAINREIDRGGQIFFLHNRVQTINTVAENLKKIVPHVNIKVGHGQMPEKQLEKVMIDFADHKFDLLVATAIIETGIDIPNANTLIVNRADMFGLAQLYQIRGRVGRSNRRAYAYLIIPKNLNDISRKRLEMLTEYDYLGAGYQIAMQDLELRGAGTMLGTKQSGVINSIGFNHYNRLLESAIENIEKKKTGDWWEDAEKADKFNPVKIEVDYYFPDYFIPDEKTRLQIYNRLLDFNDEKMFGELKDELRDRFGALPEVALQTIEFYRLRFIAKQAGLKGCKIRGNTLSLEFDNTKLPPREIIGKLMQKFTHDVKFETAKEFVMKFTLSKSAKPDKKNIYAEALKIINFYSKLQNDSEITKR
ncbi:MAG: transcription-repair coupling factor [Candidatus Cloacimonadota bacterium]|nr:MAG: transcription-repair coupling factor [Candidatus Cloacimonadota bacterium]